VGGVDMIGVLFTLTLTRTLMRTLAHPQSKDKCKDPGLILQKNIQALSLKIAAFLLRIVNFDTLE
jgi:hypothetical protein